MSFADHQDDWPTMDAGAIEDWRYCDEHHNPGETNAMSDPLRRLEQQRFTLTAWGDRPVFERQAQGPWVPWAEVEAALRTGPAGEDGADKLLKRYLDNHCQAADQEGMSTRCECQLCHDTRTYLGLPTWTPPAPTPAGESMVGNHSIRHAGPIMIACMDPTARALLDQAMTLWRSQPVMRTRR